MDPVLSVLPDSLVAVRARRSELRDSMAALEQALAAPAPGRATAWAERVHVALVELSADLRTHIQLTEGLDGLHHEVVIAAPRLAGAAKRLGADHLEITDAVSRLLNESGRTIDLRTASEAALSDEQVAAIREHGVELLGHLVRHRQAGADLVYEAYQADVGGQD